MFLAPVLTQKGRQDETYRLSTTKFLRINLETQGNFFPLPLAYSKIFFDW
jgi:hypothetical protein